MLKTGATTYDEKEKVWQGPQTKNLFNEDISAGEIALFSLRGRNPKDVMQISDSEGITMTYGEVLTAAIRIAQHFRKMQLTADHVVGIFAPNISYVTPVVLASLFNGTPFQATNCTFETNLVKHVYSFVQLDVIFCDGQYYEKVKVASKHFKPLIYTLCNHLDNVPKVEQLLEPTTTEHFFRAQPLTKGPDQTIAIMCSSGTTGLPKGVCISNRKFKAEFNFCDGSTITYSTSSMDWISGFANLRSHLLSGGKRILTSKPLTPEYLLDLIVKYKINFIITHPGYLLQLSLLPNYNKETMQSIRWIFIAGGFCSEANLKRMRSGLTNGILLYGYGSTEVGIIARNLTDYKANSVGQINRNFKIKIIDPATGERLGHNQIGEICASNCNRWLGYYRNPDATKNIIDPDDFIHTGDLGYLDEEHYLYVTGRCKDIMRYLGFQYSPQVIEDIIAQIPDVIDVCVFGVFDEVKFDVPAAAVIKREDSPLSATDVMEYVRGKTDMPFQQIHYGVFFVKELLRNSNGKLMRNEIKERCLAAEKEAVEK